MDIQSIEKYLDKDTNSSKLVNIHFKDRPSVTGILVALKDFGELKAKNFWRLVNKKNVAEWNSTNNVELSRLFNGASFTKLSAVK